MTSKSPATARRRITPQPISSAEAPAAGRVAGAFAHPQAVAPGGSGPGSAAASAVAGGAAVKSGVVDIAALPPPVSAAAVLAVPKGRRIHVKMDLDNIHVSWSRLLKSEGLDPRRAGAPSAGGASWMDSVIARYEQEYGWNVAELNEGASSEDDDGSPVDAAAAGQQASAAANAADKEAGAGSGGEGGDGEAGEEGVGEGRMNDYDRSDPFIDDSDVLAYRQSDRRKTKFSGFYVNKGTIEKLGELDPSADAGKKGKKRGRPKASEPAAAPAEASGKETGRRPKAAPKSDSAPVGGGGGGGAAGVAERSAPAASKPGKRRAADEAVHDAKKPKRSQEAAQLNGIAAASPGSLSPMRAGAATFPARSSGAGASLASMAAAAGAMAAERAPPAADADLAADGRGRGSSGAGVRDGQDDRMGPASAGTSSSDAARIAMEAFMAAGPSLGGAAGSCDGAAGSSAAAAAPGSEGTGASRGRKGVAARSSSGGRQQQYEMSAELLDAIDKLRALVEADARPDGGAPKRLPKAIIAELKAIGLLVYKECGESRKAKAQVIQEIMQFMEVISSEATVRSHISSARREKEAEVLSARAILKERIARLTAEATDSWHEQHDADGSGGGSQPCSFTLDEDMMRRVRLLAKLELELLTSGVHSPAAMDAFSRIADLFRGCRGMSGELVKTIFTQPAAAAPELEVHPLQDAEPTPTEPRPAALPASPTPSPAAGHSLPPLSPGSRGMLMVPRLTATHMPEAAIPDSAAREAPAAGQQSPSAAHFVSADPGQAPASVLRDHALDEQQQELLQLFRTHRLQGTLPPGLDGVGEEQLRCIDPQRPDFQSLLNYLKSS